MGLRVQDHPRLPQIGLAAEAERRTDCARDRNRQQGIGGSSGNEGGGPVPPPAGRPPARDPEDLEPEPAPLDSQARRRANRLVSRFKLGIDFDDCQVISVQRNRLASDQQQTLLSCSAVPAQIAPATERERMAAQVFEQLERSCPRVYGPPPLASDSDGDSVQRWYVNTDLRVTVRADDSVLVSHFRAVNILVLGSGDDVIKGKGKNPCAAMEALDVQQGKR